MTSAATVAKTIEAILQVKMCPPALNVCEHGVTSPYQVGCLLAEAGLREPPGLITKTELDETLKPKRVDVVMEDGWLDLHVRPPEVHDELKRVIAEYGENVRRGGGK